MAKSGLELINAKTGELIEDVIFRLNGELYNPEDTGFKGTFNFKNNEARKQNIRIYRPSDDDAPKPEHPEFGEYAFGISEGRKFSKDFADEDPEFSKGDYYKYWYKLCCHLGQDTNIIYNQKRRRITQIKEFEVMCQGSHTSISKFMKECFKKGFISELKFRKIKVFIANPKYVLNGNKIPKLLYNLFVALETDINEDDSVGESTPITKEGLQEP